MKLAFLHFWTLRLPRGVETLTLSLGKALAERGHAVTLLCAQGTREPLVKPLPSVRVRAFPTWRYFETTTIVPFYAWDLARARYDLVVTFFADFGEGRALQLAAPFMRARQVLYLTFPYESAPHRYAAYRRFGWERRADVIVADAGYTAARGAEFFKRRVEVLPSGTDPAWFKSDVAKRAAMRAQLGYGADQVVLLNVSALERRKGTWRVIEALPELVARCPNVRYLVMGEGPERQTLEHRAGELGVSAAVRFGGTTADLSWYYAAADVFVMLSDEEAGSVALLEAMASELPVVVSDNGGFGEVVDASCGRLVARDDRLMLVECLETLARSAALRCALGREGRRRVQAEYSWQALAGRFEDLCGSGSDSRR